MSEDGKLSEAAIAELKSKYPGVELDLITAPDKSEVVVRAPDQITYARFIAEATNEKKDRATSMRAYAMQCTVYPTPAAAEALFAKYVAFPGAIAKHLNDMAGAVEELDAKKL